MKNKFTYILVGLFASMGVVNADMFVPDFETMPAIRCDVSETIYNQDNTVVTHNKYFRIFRIDDEAKKVYLQKAPVDNLLYIDEKKVQIHLQTLTDDSIISEQVTIDRTNNTYSGTSQIMYDNAMFQSRYAKTNGLCKALN